jgi:uncharacterized protein YabN with tetrapyrrole methylase and pyrophosphatase domain
MNVYVDDLSTRDAKTFEELRLLYEKTGEYEDLYDFIEMQIIEKYPESGGLGEWWTIQVGAPCDRKSSGGALKRIYRLIEAIDWNSTD